MTSDRKLSKSLISSSAIFFVAHCMGTINGFSSIKMSSRLQSSLLTTTKRPSQTALFISSYGRGAEIWPECNEDPVQLADSFPNGQVPYSAIISIEQQDMAAVHETVEETITHEEPKRKSKRQRVSNGIKRILRRAAAKEELDSEAETGIDRVPIVIALGLLLRGLVRPLDVLLVAFLTSYLTILDMVARSPRESSGAPVLPSVPPQGHVPTMVSNPLGIGILYSKTYDLWLKLGVVIGLVGPILLLSHYMFFQKEMQAARVCARPIFLLCCQAISEAVSRRVMAPLPIRILVPLAYNTARLAYLWNWALHPAFLGPMGRALAAANGVYWASNLFAFLIPVATIRYMRAHFFGVEAAEVTTRIGMEESVGLIPNQ